MAFQEAHVPSDRRRSTRIKQRIAAEITEFKENGVAGRTFGVMIEDFSTTGVGIIHSGRLTAGGQYTLEIPRPGQPPIRVLLKVVRCSEVAGGMFTTQMQASEILKGREQALAEKKPKKARIRGVLGLLTAVGAAAIAAYWLLF